MFDEKGTMSIVDLLMNEENDCDSGTIEKALTIICTSLSFQCGAIYETDNIEHFYKKEAYEADARMLPEQVVFQISNVPSRSKHKIYHIDQETYRPTAQIDILGLFGVSNMIMISLGDDEIQGFLAFAGTKERMQLDEEAEKSLFVMTGLLGKYIMTRSNKKRMNLIRKTYESIIDNTGIDIYVNDFYTHEILYINKSMAAPYGGKEAFDNGKCWEVLFPGKTGPCDFCPQKYIVDENGKPSSVYTWDYCRAFDGAWFRVFSAAFYWTDGRLAHVVSSADITDNKQKEATIQYMANYDELTDLPNRRKLIIDGRRYIQQIQDDENIYVLFFDIDGFKKINDSYGHDGGDEFLVSLSLFFKRNPMLKDAVYRNGGDEFVGIVYGKGITKKNIENLCRFIHARFNKEWVIKKDGIFCNISIGIACYGEDGSTIEELLQTADMAMYCAKKKGEGNMCYGSDVEENQ